MSDKIVTYILVGVFVFFMVLSIGIKIEKMTRVIIGNILLGIFCAFGSFSLYTISQTMGADAGFGKFLYDIRYILPYIVYVSGLIFIYFKFSIKGKSQNDLVLQKTSYLLYVPMTALGIYTTVLFIYILPKLCNGYTLQGIASSVVDNEIIQNAIIYSPYIFMLYVLFTILLFCDFSLKNNNE